jgi:glutathione peroxidase-family protein
MLRQTLLGAVTALSVGGAAAAAPAINQPAPAFTAVDADGKTRSLKEFRGKTVVLEWVNEGCPYVQKHYDTGNMQKTQKLAKSDGAVWLTVVSSAPGMQGHVNGDQAKSFVRNRGASPTAFLLDPDGKVGKAYDARTTPHMYVVDKAGKLVYMGGIDDKATANKDDVRFAKNYVTAALADLRAGRAVATPVSKPYGCSVKYAG